MFRGIFESVGEKMTLFEDGKRVCARGITFIDDQIVLIERYKKVDNEFMHYYTIPGGGVDIGESYEDAAVRETYEETTIKAKVESFLGKEEYDTGIVYWYLLKYISGTPELSGEELERNCSDNYYKVLLKKYTDLDELNILGQGKDMVEKAYLEYKKN